jgi:hypothetical protein
MYFAVYTAVILLAVLNGCETVPYLEEILPIPSVNYVTKNIGIR